MKNKQLVIVIGKKIFLYYNKLNFRIQIVKTMIIETNCLYRRNEKQEKIRNRRPPSDDVKLCRKLLSQSENSKPTEKIIFKAYVSLYL